MVIATRISADAYMYRLRCWVAIAKSESWQEAFHHGSQSDTALHDFNAKYEVQPPDRHGLWFRDAILVYPSPLVASIPREPKHLDAALQCAQSCHSEGPLALGYHYQTAHYEP